MINLLHNVHVILKMITVPSSSEFFDQLPEESDGERSFDLAFSINNSNKLLDITSTSKYNNDETWQNGGRAGTVVALSLIHI